MKIYLLTPRNPESFWTFDRILPSLRKKCVFPNLALPTIAAATPPEHEVVLCDENVEAIDFNTDADIVGITGYVVHKKRILQILDAFKKRGKFVVVGGPFASLYPDEVRGRADVVFLDEADSSWPQFLRDYEKGCWKPEYAQEEKTDMQTIPLPRFDLLKIDRYRTMTIQFARGCPYNCEFCDIIVMYGRKPRTKTVDQVMAEVRELHRLGVENIFVVDDNFIGYKKRAQELLQAVAEWQKAHDYPMQLMTEVTLNIAQEKELLRLMKEANFTSIFIGIESPRAASLEETKKTQNMREDLLTAVHRVQEAGMEVMAGMIVGFDHDDVNIFDEQFRFIQDARIPLSMTGLLNAIPRTPLYRRLCEAGRLIAEHMGDQFVFTNVIPKGMSRLELYEGYKRLLQRLYDYRNYRRRAMDLVLNQGTMIESKILASRRDLWVFFRLLWTCILRASPRRSFMTLRMMTETLLRRPRAFRHAVTLALMHKHMYEYVREVSGQLDRLIEELRTAGEVGLLPQPVRSSELPLR